jgi:hypothetical protein
MSNSGPLSLVLSRLERVRPSGKGFTAKCPAHADRPASLSLCEGNGGTILLHCFAGCPALSVVQAVGLSLADLFPERIGPVTPARQQELRHFAREAKWRAAAATLGIEAVVVEIAAGQLLTDEPLNWTDWQRLSLAHDRITSARAVLA